MKPVIIYTIVIRSQTLSPLTGHRVCATVFGALAHDRSNRPVRRKQKQSEGILEDTETGTQGGAVNNIVIKMKTTESKLNFYIYNKM